MDIELADSESEFGGDSAVPMCARCKKPVDRVDTDKCIITGCFEFAFFCHGVVECAHLTIQEIERGVELRECFTNELQRPTVAALKGGE